MDVVTEMVMDSAVMGMVSPTTDLSGDGDLNKPGKTLITLEFK